MRRVTRRGILRTVVTAAGALSAAGAASAGTDARTSADAAGTATATANGTATDTPRTGGRTDSTALRAGTPLWRTWSRVYGDGGYDRLEAAAAAPSGAGAVLAGQSDDPPGDRWVGWLHRTGPDGAVRWHRTFDDDWLEAALAVEPVGDGAVVAGRRRRSPAASFDAWVRRTDRAGRVRWRWTSDEGGEDAATAVVGGDPVRVAGTTRTGGRSAAWVRAFDDEGSVVTRRTYGEERDLTVADAAPTRDGGAFLAGAASAPDQVYADAWLARVGPDGELAWRRTYGGDGAERAAAVRETGDGAVFVGLTGSGRADQWDLRVAGVGGDGERRFDRSHGGDGADYATDLLPVEGGYVVVGASDSGDRDRFDALTLGVGADGTYRWHRFDGGPGRDVARAVVPAPDLADGSGGVLVAGRYGSVAPDRTDAWLLGLSAPDETPTPAPETPSEDPPTPVPAETATASPTPTLGPIDMAQAREDESTTAAGPGFGLGAALAALGVGGWLARTAGRSDRRDGQSDPRDGRD